MTLTSFVSGALPPEWRRDVRVEPIADGFRARFTDEAGHDHSIEARRGAERCFVRGDTFGYSYGAGPHADVAKYRALFLRIAADEARLPSLLAMLRDVPPPVPETSIFLREGDLRAPIDPPERAHVYLYFEAPCRQSCQFCQEPAQRVRPESRGRQLAIVDAQERGTDFVGSGALDVLLARLAERNGALTIHGHDWAMHPRLDALLDRLAREERVPIALLGPSTRLADPALAARVASIKTLRRLTLTLLSADPARHDAIVGAPGAGEQVLAAIEQLRAHGVEPIVNVVLTTDVVEGLPALLALLDSKHLRAALLGFVPDRGPAQMAHLLAPASEIRAALEGEVALRVVDGAAGLPLCALPPALRSRSSGVWPSTDRSPFVHPKACDTCALKSTCTGVPPEYDERFGSRGLTPSPALS